jgi:hypothetical protein
MVLRNAESMIFWMLLELPCCMLFNTGQTVSPWSTDGRTPEEIFSKMPSSYIDITQFHPLGCPIYVLDAQLQNGNKISRWEPCSRVGMYLGHSPYHAQSVALILNLSTGHVLPQYYLVYDDQFTTVPCLQIGTILTNWPDLYANNCELLTDVNYQ